MINLDLKLIRLNMDVFFVISKNKKFFLLYHVIGDCLIIVVVLYVVDVSIMEYELEVSY